MGGNDDDAELTITVRNPTAAERTATIIFTSTLEAQGRLRKHFASLHKRQVHVRLRFQVAAFRQMIRQQVQKMLLLPLIRIGG